MPENNELNLSPEEIRLIKSQYNKAKHILENVLALEMEFNSAQVALNAQQVNLEKVSNDSRERFTTIDNAKNDSATLLSEIKSNLEKTQSSISQIDEGLLRFENIKGKIEGRDGEIDLLVQTANALKNDIENLKTSAQQRLAEIEGLLVQVQKQITQMQQEYERFVATQSKITDKNNGLEAVLAQSSAIQKKSAEVFVEIQSFRDESKKYLDEIQKNEESSGKLKAEIEGHLQVVTEKRTEVEKVVDLITDTGFANSFQKRERTLRFAAYFWLAILLSSITALSILLYKFFGKQETVPEIGMLLYRLTLTSPLLFLIGFSIRQYGNERTLEEKYAFKATIATVMRSHSDFLIDKANDTDIETAGVIRETIQNLYAEPYDKNVDWKKVNSALQKSSEDRKTFGRNVIEWTKELKALIPDDAQLKNLLEVFLRMK